MTSYAILLPSCKLSLFFFRESILTILCSVYSLFSALIMHVYQMRSSNPAIVQATEQRLQTCMTALKQVSKVWLVAKMVYALFESILGNKVLEERLQKAAGRRHQKKGSRAKNGPQQSPPIQQPQERTRQKPKSGTKRDYEEMDMGYPNGPPAPQVSYERSRPQTPAMTPSRELPPQVPVITVPTSKSPPNMPRNDAFMGNSRNTTRPTSPFNGTFFPGTPPDLFLVTRNSPTISQDLWHNFQPDQLFPADTQIFPTMSPNSAHDFIDPQLAGQPPQIPAGLNGNTSPGMPGQPQQLNQHPQYVQFAQRHLHPQPHMNGGMLPQMQPGQQMPPHQNDPHGWAQLDMLNRGQQKMNEETWSNSTMSQGPIVPTTLNVEDW